MAFMTSPGAFARTRLAALLLLLAAGWPVALWYAARVYDGSDEPLGLIALLVALLFAPWKAWCEPLPPARLKLGCSLLALYVAAFPFLPPLIRAVLFVTLFGVIAAPRGFATAWWGLLMLSLPVIATLQFYLGYPLRFLTTHLCAWLLKLGGLSVRAEGTTLHWAGERVIVDAPCSGIHMLWTGLFITAAVACWHRFDFRQTFALARLASFTVFVANVLRAAALFCIESGLWPKPSWAHEGIGLILFAAAALVILTRANRIADARPAHLTVGHAPLPA